MAELPLAEGIGRFKQNEDRMDRFTNGSDTETFTTSGGAVVPAIRKFLKDKDTEINVGATSVLSQANAAKTAAETARTGAETARSGSETARDESVSAKNTSQAWAAGTLPGGTGTKSAKEWSELTKTYLGSGTEVAILADIGSKSIDSLIQVIKTTGYYAAGDGGGATYKRVAAQPSHSGKIQSADGAWFELDEEFPNIMMFGARAGNTSYAAANVTAINNAIAYKSAKGGGKVFGGQGVFYISTPIIHQSTGVDLDGLGRKTTLKATTGFTATSLVALRGTRNVVTDMVLDCSALAGASVWVSGVRTEGASTVDCGVRGCEIKDASFCGIWMDDNAGGYTHLRYFVEDNIVTNVGWMGISLCGTVKGRISRNDVSRTGYTAIWAEERNVGLRIVGNDVTKAVAPYRIYNGAGSAGGVEKGFMIGYAPSNQDTLIADNRCIDNRNAAEDGIGLGENGTEHGPCIIRNNFVQYAGLFGIDVASQSTVIGNRIVEPAQSGIFMSLDLGGSIAQSVVKDNTIRNCNGPYAIQISQNMGNNLTIADCEIIGNVIVDYRSTPNTQYAIRIRKNNLTITNLRISDNIGVNVGTGGLLNDGSGTDWPIYVSGNRWKDVQKSIAAFPFSATGYESFSAGVASAAELRAITGGYEGKEILVQFSNANATLKPDWANSLGNSTNRIVGLANVPRAMAAGDAVKMRYFEGLGWHILAIIDAE